MPRKILHRISRIFNHKDNETNPIVKEPCIVPTTTIHNNSSLPILLQRAPSSKLLIDDYLDVSTIEYSSSYNNLHQQSLKENRQSWLTSITRLKTLKRSSHRKRKSTECWFVTQGEIEIPDQQQQGVRLEEELLGSSPLSVTSSLCSANNRHHLSSSSSSWLPIESDSASTARTSIDSQTVKSLVVTQPQLKQASCISLAENVKHILGDAIFIADQELDI
ncbi:uncharacterized protein EV154DRAFT_479787 [Mucor mucedo]|uniref:uncharacterized protein n=1 Tax=Mucor mucedo TaxID=29922 RepID=UPI002220390F|nr:uncharacterized protein EV154DRAFT_479787 [Mucor mucedo]KAI7892880.1 hypothetical protein EV154DRAFT_479787 [Mucor mucedo]